MTSQWRHYKKQWQNSDLRETKQTIYHSECIDRASKRVLLIEFEPLCQKLWAFLSNFGSFYHAHSPNIRSCQMTQAANFENFLFCSNSKLILGKVTKFLVGRLSTISHDPSCKFRKFLFCPNSKLILGKVTKFLVGKLSTLNVISQNPHRGINVN